VNRDRFIERSRQSGKQRIHRSIQIFTISQPSPQGKSRRRQGARRTHQPRYTQILGSGRLYPDSRYLESISQEARHTQMEARCTARHTGNHIPWEARYTQMEARCNARYTGNPMSQEARYTQILGAVKHSLNYECSGTPTVRAVLVSDKI